ncbi:MAG: cytochrome c [Sphingomonadales bacterium]|jgi:mono/diheme cytochrome c family protein
MRVTNALLAVPAALMFLTCAVAQGAPTAAEPPGAENLPAGPGKALVIQSCSQCHQPDIVVGQKRDAAAWRDLVDQMVARGANIEQGNYDKIIAYLAQSS